MTLTAAGLLRPDDVTANCHAASASVGPASRYQTTTPAAAAVGQPNSSSKTIYLIRHGEGWHNIGYERNLDPHLTPRGWWQTAALQQHLAALQDKLNLELVVVSPLRRTLETAAGVFGAAGAPQLSVSSSHARQAAAAVAATATAGHPAASWLLMRPQVAQPQQVTEAAKRYLPVARAVGSAADAAGNGAGDGPRPLRLLAHEGCRERIGPNVCDRFRDISLQAADFPGVDFSLIRHERDVDWERLSSAPCQDVGCYQVGEEEAATEARALAFYHWLMARPESHIAVVSHCGFLVHGMRALGRGMLCTWNDVMLQAATKQQELARGDLNSGPVFDGAVAESLRVTAGDVGGRMSVDWQNCEMRSIILQRGPGWRLESSRGATGGSVQGKPQQQQQWLWATPGDASTWFPGGLYGDV